MRIGQLGSTLAKYAALNLQLNLYELIIGFAVITVSRSGVERVELTMKQESALCAETHLSSTSMQEHFVAPETAVLYFVGIKSIKKIGKADVFNMTVEEHHNYLVNSGLLSKNCDTDRYVLTSPLVIGDAGSFAIK